MTREHGDAAPTLTAFIRCDNSQNYRLSDTFRSLLATRLAWHDDLQIEWLSGVCETADIISAVATCNSKYVIFIDEGHTVSDDFFSVMAKQLSTQNEFLADAYRYTDRIPTQHMPSSLTEKYYYRRDTDIWGTAFNTDMMREFLCSLPTVDRRAIYTCYRLYYHIDNVTPLSIGYCTHDDTTNINGIELGPQTTDIFVPANDVSLELLIYTAKLLIGILRKLAGDIRCPLSLSHMRGAAQMCTSAEVSAVIPIVDHIEYHALCYMADQTHNKAYLHKRLGEFDAIVEYSTEQFQADCVDLHKYEFADGNLYSSKRYVPHDSPRGCQVVDSYRRQITSDSIILFYDRSTQADDNAEALYRYFTQNYPQFRNAYFAISPQCADWSRLALDGFRLVPMFSADFYDKFLHSDLVVSSQIYNISFKGKDLSNSRSVYLQHGVMMNDMRQWILSKRFDLFVATGEPEAAYLRSLAPLETVNCGIPRLESLGRRSHEGTRLIYMPTWRFNLDKLSDLAFAQSDYFLAVDAILRDRRLNKYLEDTDSSLLVKMHPNFQKRAPLFFSNSRIKFTPERYADLIETADFIFTDYSSVVLDAAFINIPIAYYPFDAKTFFAEQPYAERMDYDTDGLGPVFYTKDDLVEYITTQRYNAQDPQFSARHERFFQGVPLGKMRQTLIERMLEL